MRMPCKNFNGFLAFPVDKICSIYLCMYSSHIFTDYVSVIFALMTYIEKFLSPPIIRFQLLFNLYKMKTKLLSSVISTCTCFLYEYQVSQIFDVVVFCFGVSEFVIHTLKKKQLAEHCASSTPNAVDYVPVVVRYIFQLIRCGQKLRGTP